MNSPYRQEKVERLLVYVGTYTGGASQGVYICQLDTSSGELVQVGLAGNVDNPSYLAIDAERLRLFAVNEHTNTGGRVSAFAIQPGPGALSFINQQDSGGGAPCYLSLDQSGRYLLVANYLGGSVAVIPIGEDGRLDEPSDIVTHAGSGPNPERQDGPHPHSIILDPGSNYAFVPDLGLDRVLQYRLDRAAGQLLANEEPWAPAAAGSGPRHLIFHQRLQRAYVINELNSTVSAYEYDGVRGTLAPFQTLSTLPDGFAGANIAADLHLTPNGRFLYGSNRGHDSIAAYAVDQQTGALSLVGFAPTQGRRPRGFAIDPAGRFLLVANQDSDRIVSFRVDVHQGALAPTGHQLAIPSPVCLKFLSTQVD